MFLFVYLSKNIVNCLKIANCIPGNRQLMNTGCHLLNPTTPFRIDLTNITNNLKIAFVIVENFYFNTQSSFGFGQFNRY